MTQADVASRSGLQPAAVSHFETGLRRPSLANLARLADALEVSADFLLGRKDTYTRADLTAARQAGFTDGCLETRERFVAAWNVATGESVEQVEFTPEWLRARVSLMGATLSIAHDYADYLERQLDD